MKQAIYYFFLTGIMWTVSLLAAADISCEPPFSSPSSHQQSPDKKDLPPAPKKQKWNPLLEDEESDFPANSLSVSTGKPKIINVIKEKTRNFIMLKTSKSLPLKTGIMPPTAIPSLSPHDSTTIHQSLNTKGYALIKMQSLFTPEIAEKVRVANIELNKRRLYVMGSDNWYRRKASMIKRNLISAEDLQQFENELFLFIEEITQAVSHADNQVTLSPYFWLLTNEEDGFLPLKGHKHFTEYYWATATSAIIGPGTWFEHKKHGAITTALPGHSFVLSDNFRNWTIPASNKKLVLHGTPSHIPGKRLAVIITFVKKPRVQDFKQIFTSIRRREH